MEDSGKERKSYGHDFLLFAWETVELMPVDNVSVIIRVSLKSLRRSCQLYLYNIIQWKKLCGQEDGIPVVVIKQGQYEEPIDS